MFPLWSFVFPADQWWPKRRVPTPWMHPAPGVPHLSGLWTGTVSTETVAAGSGDWTLTGWLMWWLDCHTQVDVMMSELSPVGWCGHIFGKSCHPLPKIWCFLNSFYWLSLKVSVVCLSVVCKSGVCEGKCGQCSAGVLSGHRDPGLESGALQSTASSGRVLWHQYSDILDRVHSGMTPIYTTYCLDRVHSDTVHSLQPGHLVKNKTQYRYKVLE